MTMDDLSAAPMADDRWLLAIDTSTEQAGFALFNGTRMTELSWPAGRTQTVSVLPRINDLLGSLDLALEDVGAVGVARGPGTFTGLRVGLSIAKGLAIVGDRSLIGIDTLAISARPFTDAGLHVLAVLPAGRQRLVWAVFGEGIHAATPRNTTLEELRAYLGSHRDLVVAGELLPEQRAEIVRSHGAVVSAAGGARRTGVLAELAWDRWRRGDVDDPATIEPLYLHGKAMGGSTGQ